MQGVGLGSLHSSHAYRLREATPAPVAVADGRTCQTACSPCTDGADAQRQALYQSVVLVLREKFSVSGQAAPAPVAGLSPTEQADNRLAATLGAALNTSAGVPAEQVIASAEAGLQEASSGLAAASSGAADLGDIAAEIRARMQSLVSAFMANRENGSAESVTAAKVTTRERGVLEIHTLEGDVVKIDFRNSTSVRLGSSEVAGGTQDSLKVRISQRTSLQVEGDLNQAELAAIGDLVRKVDTLASEFFAGDVEQAFAAAAGLQIDGTQLADYSLQLSMSQKVRIRSAESLVPGLPAPSSLPATGVATPAATVSPDPKPDVPGAPAEAVAAAPAPADLVGPAPAADAAATPAPAGTVDKAVANVQQIIGSFVAKLRANFSMSATDTGLGLTSSIKLRLLVEAIESHTKATPATPAATSALVNVVDQTGS